MTNIGVIWFARQSRARLLLTKVADFLFHTTRLQQLLVLNDSEGVDCKRSESAWAMSRPLQTGWYMVEVQSVFEGVIARARVDLATVCGEGVHTLGLDLHAGRVVKRLIRITAPKVFVFVIQKEHGECELVYFRLKRVTLAFARSRMLTKLLALHPFYKRFKVLPGRFDASPALPSLDTLWADYCRVFEAGAELMPYAEWLAGFTGAAPPVIAAARPVSAGPLLSVVMPAFNTSVPWLLQAVRSVMEQSYPHWELCIADDASTDPAMKTALDGLADDSRIRIVRRPQNGHISAASNSAIEIASGKWLVLLDHDDELAPDALFWIAEAINRHPGCQLIYSDEDKIDESGVRSDPYFKPDWNPDLFLSQNMFSHLGAYRADLVRSVGGFRVGLEGSQDYDLALRCAEKICPDQIVHIPRVLYHWRIHAGSTAHAMEAKPYAMVAGERALNEHLQRRGLDATAEAVGYGYRVRYALPASPPLVSLIIPTRNGLKLLKQCIDSIVAKTDYPRYELIVVDNGSDDKATLRYLALLAERANVWVMRDDRPFNYSALNNAAVRVARGEVLGLLNNDLEVINADWLTEMVSHALRPEIGAVGARLWYGDDTLQHAGVVLGIHGVAGHVHRFLPRSNVGYCGRAALIQSFSAVTGACLVVRKSIYEAVGGLNETALQVACNDIDFCLKVRKAGYRNLWTPYAELYHHESASRGFDDTPEKQARSAKEVAYMNQHWGDLLRDDPAYNPNLTLDSEDFGLAWPPRVPSLQDMLLTLTQHDPTQASSACHAPYTSDTSHTFQ